MVNPIKPEEVILRIPDFIIEAVNDLIKEKWDGQCAVIKQNEIMEIVSSDDPEDPRPSRKKVFDHNWLDFEPMYRQVGWGVLYDKPGLGENFDAYFKFTKKST